MAWSRTGTAGPRVPKAGSLLTKRLLAARVDALDHVVGQVERGLGPEQTRIAIAEPHVDALFSGDLGDQRQELALELHLQVALQDLQFFLRILLGALEVAILPLDVLLGRVAGAVVH